MNCEETLPEDIVPQLALNIPPVLHPWAREEGMLVVDDLLLASGSRQDMDASALRLVSPDPNTRYRLTKALPAEAQQLPVEVVGTADLKDLTLWVDGEQVVTFGSSPYKTWWPLAEGKHTMWVEGADGNGEVVQSEVIQFEVMAAITLSE